MKEKTPTKMKMSLAHCNPQEWPLVPRLCVRKASSREQEEAVSNAIEAVLRKVLEAIREHELDELGYKYSSTFVAESVLRVYTLANIRCDRLRRGMKKQADYLWEELIVPSVSTSLLNTAG